MDNIADIDGIVLERVKAAGGIVIGKTNTSHYGYTGHVRQDLIGPPCRKPWRLDQDLRRGIERGAASAVAAGLGAIAHGSDRGGLDASPAAFCGVFGSSKPSLGRVPLWPTTDVWAARSHNGPIARRWPTPRYLLGALAGPDARDPLGVDAYKQEDFAAEAVPDPLPALRAARRVERGYQLRGPRSRGAPPHHQRGRAVRVARRARRVRRPGLG